MTINCNGILIDLTSPKIMGILNITPDSFYDGGKYIKDREILLQVEEMLREGATFIDIGAYSSRPGAEHVCEEEEINRILPAVTSVLERFPEALLSIDTFRSKVAKECIEAGAAIVNDISAGNMDTDMFQTVADLKAPYVMMHMKGTPQTMQKDPTYDDISKEMMHYFSKKINEAKSLGIKDIIIDPGFGFGKTIEHNYEVLSKLALFKNLEMPILVGVSRKSMIYKILNSSPSEALNGTTVVNTIALTKGANILRVHDVKEAMECIKLAEMLNP
ncbi:dihydropteroate synthase [Sungkyunkwania multivorans]|uniref:Dihydropteroate synthase n=1 Tax=Sungkyunkwania multivorans TaxID=1173618 RepID=A0ABW3CZH7_9FLAO